MKALLLCSTVVYLTAVQCTIVETPNGKLQGSFNGVYYSFMNIPFAEPPTGARRFEAPRPYRTKWSGIRNASVVAASCVEVEDCLVLNIFTPKVNPKQKYTVRIFLYGGGFMFGTARDIAEQFVASEGIVFVIPNYRTAAFGFLSSGTDLVSGNFGLKDQQLALKWVHENIHAFGGDPSKVLLTGVSAGGASVQLHLLNPGSWRYFNSAISSSGSVLNPWVIQPDPKKVFKKYIGLLGCNSPTPQRVKQCLLDRTMEEHANATKALQQFRANPFNVFGVVVESQKVENAFLTEHPRTLMKKGQISQAPWIVEHSQREGTYTAAEFLSYDENGTQWIEILNTRWRELAPIFLFYENNCVGCSEAMATKYKNNYSDYLRRIYMKGKNFSAETYQSLEDMFTDQLFVNGITISRHLHGVYGQGSVYSYIYRHCLPFGIGNILSEMPDEVFCADHGADQQCVAPLKFLEQPNPCPPYTKSIADSLIKMGRDLSITGIAKYAGKKLPVNNATQTGSLTIYKTYNVIETYSIKGGYTREIFNNTIET